MQRKPESPCPACGAYAREFKEGHSVCAYCGAALPPLPYTHPAGRIPNPTPIRVGMRAKIDGRDYIAIGRVRFSEPNDESVSRWDEWVLTDADGGFLFLEYDEGNWTLARPLAAPPSQRGTPRESGTATIESFEGQIPWPIRIGEKAQYAEYGTNPVYSSEISAEGEIEWFEGRPLFDRDVLDYFGLDTLVQAHDRQDTMRGDRRRLGCLTGILAVATLIGWAVARSAHGTPRAALQTTVNQVPEDGLRFGPYPLNGVGRIHRLRLSSQLTGTSMWVQALVEDDAGPVIDADAEFWDESGYDEGPWHEWVLETSADFRLQQAGGYFIRVFADPEAAATSAPIAVSLEEGVPTPLPLAVFSIGGLALSVVLLIAGSPGVGKKVWEGTASR